MRKAKFRSPAVLIAAALLFISQARAATTATLDPLTGARASLSGLQNVLASPPLPSLRTKENTALTFQGGYGVADITENAETSGYLGKLQGASGGIGFTSKAKNGFGYFATAVGNAYYGSINTTDINGNVTNSSISFSNMSVEGLAIVLGGSWRVIGDNSSILALGFFGGGMWAIMHTAFDLSGQNLSDHFSSAPTIYGGILGAQLEVRLGSFMVKPYVFSFSDVSKPCKPFDGPDTLGGGACDGGKTLPLYASFGAVGINVGYKRFKVNAYSKVTNDDSLGNVVPHNYQLSYSIEYQ